MPVKVVLFDLDGTLLPMDQETFIHGYFSCLTQKAAEYGYDRNSLVASIWQGVAAMVKNTGINTNKILFHEAFEKIYGSQAKELQTIFDTYYQTEFDTAKAFCGYNPAAAETVRILKKNGIRVVLATNPIFPAVATERRICWTGLTPNDFELYTTYENSCYCKPNLDYYREILRKLQVKPEDCLMVGNDVAEDMVAQSLGMQVFLLTDCLINKERKDISVYPKGTFLDLMRYLNIQ